MHLSTLIRQKSYEHVEYVLRRHPVTFVPKILLFLLLLGVPVAAGQLILFLYPDIVENTVLFPLGILLGSAYVLGVLLFFFTLFVEQYLDIWIVTNDRVVDVDQATLFSRTIAELDLFRIQDVTTTVEGFFPTLFTYGEVEVKTASENEKFVFHQVPNPNMIREELIRLAHIDQKYHYLSPVDRGTG